MSEKKRSQRPTPRMVRTKELVTWEAANLSWNPSVGIADPSRMGFESEKAGWEYVSKYLCSSCRQDLEQGFIDFAIELDGSVVNDRIKISCASQTSCGAEWCVDAEV